MTRLIMPCWPDAPIIQVSAQADFWNPAPDPREAYA
jgi:hypothetical protein